MSDTPVDVLERARGWRFLSEDEEELELELLPPPGADEIEAFERILPGTLPTEIRELLGLCSGVEVGGAEIDFLGRSVSGQFLEGASPFQLDIQANGAGNSWYVDILSDGTWGGVHFACHDPPVLLLQSPDLASFLEGTLAEFAPDADASHLSVWSDPEGIWPRNPLALALDDARGSDDPVVRSFAETLPEHALVVDLRGERSGMGLNWGCFGPETEIRRSGDALVFGLLPPPGYAPRRRKERSTRKSWFSRLLGR